MKRTRLALLLGTLLLVQGAGLIGCTQPEQYHDPRLQLTVGRMDPELENRWGLKGVVVRQAPPGEHLQVGDLITHLASRWPVQNEEQLRRALRNAMGPRKRFWQVNKEEASDGTALLEVDRKGERVVIELAARKPSEWDETGLEFSGTQVTALRRGYEKSSQHSPAENSGVQIGDRILAVIDEDPVPDVKAFQEAAKRAAQAEAVYVYTAELSGIRLQAITALGQLGGDDPRVRDRLLEIVATSPDRVIRRTAASALVSLAPYQKDVVLLRAMLGYLTPDREPDVEIRRSAAAIVELLAQQLPPSSFDEEAIRIVAASMEDPDPGVHFKAGVVLARLKERAVPLLVDRLEHHPSETVRDIAASALGEIGTPAAREALVRALWTTEAVPLQLTIATALARIGDPIAWQELERLQATTSHSGVREFVRQLLHTAAQEAASPAGA